MRELIGKFGIALLTGLALPLLAVGGAEAHKTSLADIDVGIEGGAVRVRLAVSAHDLAVALGEAIDPDVPVPAGLLAAKLPVVEDYVRDRLTVRAGDHACTPAPPRVDLSQANETVRFTLAFTCPQPFDALTLAYRLFFEIDPDHVAVGRARAAGGEQELLLDRNGPDATMAVTRSRQPSGSHRYALRIVRFGALHILQGFDHLLFLLALIMGAPGWSRLIKIVTAFTVAHSVTLGLAWYGAIVVPARLVESLIALTIVIVAIENIAGRGANRRWMVAGGFGLVHGLGFLGALRELSPAEGSPIITLLAFNVGVEIGQLLAVAAVLVPFTWWVGRRWFRASSRLASGAVVAIATVWLLQRASGLTAY